MNPDEICKQFGNVNFIPFDQAWLFYDFIRTNNLRIGLGLGFTQAASAAYMAGAIEELGSGMLFAIDREDSRDRDASIERLLGKASLSHLATVFYEPRSYNWRLMKFLDEERYETFDFCYFDGAYSWYETGFAFCLVERLLKPGGWAIFNRLNYSPLTSAYSEKPWIKRLPEQEQVTRHVEQVFRLLVESNPNFGVFRRLKQLAFAQKRSAVWTKQKRAENSEEILASQALERACSDSEFRDALLLSPASTLSELSCRPAEEFSHLRFVLSESLAPIPPTKQESGETLIFIPRSFLDFWTSKTALENMLERGSSGVDLGPDESS